MADIIVVDPNLIDQAAGDCQRMATDLRVQLDDLTRQLGRLEWVGAARGAYDADQQKWNTAAEDIREVVDGLGAATHQASQRFSADETAVKNMFGG